MPRKPAPPEEELRRASRAGGASGAHVKAPALLYLDFSGVSFGPILISSFVPTTVLRGSALRPFDSCRPARLHYPQQTRAWEVRSNAVAARIRTHENTARSASVAGVSVLLSSRIVKSLIESHETLSVIFARSDDELPKHQAAVILVTSLLAMLAVDCWCGAPPALQKSSPCRARFVVSEGTAVQAKAPSLPPAWRRVAAARTMLRECRLRRIELWFLSSGACFACRLLA